MTLFKHQLCFALALFYSNLLVQQSCAELATPQGAPINNLYDNLLQREYAGPIVFPNHQVERKAQRSPSLRLRFGRSDPDMLNSIVEKRWFGDVNQKPIRSPSLRLRFGRRSDPNLPQMRRSAYDDLLERELTMNNVDTDNAEQLDYDAAYERVVRKPQRLRWGRSVPQYEPNVAKDDFERAQLYNSLLNSDKLRHMLLALQQYDDNAIYEDAADVDNIESQEFQREARKPMRLRWGRSTGKAPQAAEQKTPQATESAAKAQN